MHGHETQLPDWIIAAGEWMDVLFVVAAIVTVLFLAGMPIPVGYERGKVAWLAWCGTGMHAHVVYHTKDGFQTLHPKDRA